MSRVLQPILCLLMLSLLTPPPFARPGQIRPGPFASAPTETIADGTTPWSNGGEEAVEPMPARLSLRTLPDIGNVAVIETGSAQDPATVYGAAGTPELKSVAREYFAHHRAVDFLLLLVDSGSPPRDPAAKGFYQQVSNDVHGIGLPIFDNSARFGSPGRLQGIVELEGVGPLAAAPYGPGLAAALDALAHEMMHRFAAYVRFRLPDGNSSGALIGRHAAHWSNLLSSRGSIMYGNVWSDNGNGTFTAIGARNGYSPLDLYLMGMLPGEKVPPLLLIDNPQLDTGAFSNPGETISGAARTVTIDDIIAAEGPRLPDAAASQKRFRVGFLLLAKKGASTTNAAAAIEILRNAFAGRFARLTHGRGAISGVAPILLLDVKAPGEGANLPGPDITVSGTVVNSTGAETTVTVNGRRAEVIGETFQARGIPLRQGSNKITVSASDGNGLAATVATTVNGGAGHYLRIVPSVTEGTDPLSISLQLAGSFPIAAASVTLTGPASGVLTQEPGSPTISALLRVQGTYTISASATTPEGDSCSDAVTVTVLPKPEL